MGQLNRTTAPAIIRFALDVLGLAAAWWATFFIRLLLNPLFVRLTAAQLQALAPPLLYIATLWVCASIWLSIRRPERRIHAAASLLSLLESVATASTLTIVVTFFFRQFGAELSRSFVLLFMPVSLITMLIAGYTADLTIGALRERTPERVAIVGDGEEAWRVAECVNRATAPAIFAGMILPEAGSRSAAAGSGNVLGTTSMLAELINRTRLDRIIIVNGCISDSEVNHCGTVSSRMGIVLNRSVPLPLTGGRIDISRRFGIPLLEMRPVTFTRRQEFIKRGFDILVAGLVLILLSPLVAFFAILIKLTSPGPVLYKAQRVGRGGRYFTFLKFRSMYASRMSRSEVSNLNEKSGKLFKIKNDPRVTRVGRFMRKYSVDELPQLINVLRGDMSLVGPRPLPAEDLDPDGHSSEFGAWSEQRARVLPGITGLWQIRGRSNLSFNEMIDLDIEYIRNWSLDLDLQILLTTPVVVINGRGAF